MRSLSRPLQLLLPECTDPLQLLLPDCVRFNCCSPIVSASTAAPQLSPLQLLLPIASASTAAPRMRPLQPLLPNCVHFSCCSPIASASTAARQLHPLVVEDSRPCLGPIFSNILRGVGGSVLKYKGHVSLV